MTQAGPTAIGYTPRGNVSSKGAQSYIYTSEDKLSAAVAVSYMIRDALGRVIDYNDYAHGGTEYTLLNDGLDAIRDGPDRFVFAGTDEPIAWYDGSGARHFLHPDERGSIVAVTDSAGALTGINKYDDYGNAQGALTGKFGYTGQRSMSFTGLYDYRNRVYDPGEGRFLQTDPIGYVDSPNLYVYAVANPVGFKDPFGTTICTGSLIEQTSCSNIPGLSCTGDCSSFAPAPTEQEIAALLTGVQTTDLGSAFSLTPHEQDCVADASKCFSLASSNSGGLNGNGYSPQTMDYFLLASTILGEAAAQPSAYSAIGWTVVNRVGAPSYPNTLAGVVFQPGQFDAVNHSLFQEAYLGFGIDLSPGNAAAFLQTQIVAERILSGTIQDPTGGAMHFFSGPPITKWERQMQVLLRVGGFTFGP